MKSGQDPLEEFFLRDIETVFSYVAGNGKPREVFTANGKAYFSEDNVIRREMTTEELTAELQRTKQPEARELLSKILERLL